MSFGRDADQDELTQEHAIVPHAPQPARAYTLQVVEGPRKGDVLVIDGASAVLGRGPESSLRIPDPSLSRAHARLEREGATLWIRDLDSRNGTFVAEQRITERVALKGGELVRLGGVVLRFALEHVAAVQASRDLYDAAMRDRLTGLYNRGFFDDRLKAEFAFARRHGIELAVLLIDIDHFKRVNDSYGHGVGDAVLRAVGEKIQESVRTEDVAARYGGEEFVVLARGAPVEGAEVLGQRLRTRIGMAETYTQKGPLSVSVSIGIAVQSREMSYASRADLIASADEALYASKRNGRDRVTVNLEPSVATQRIDGSYSMHFEADRTDSLKPPVPKK